ncbi:MAG: hypothetical protein LBU65_13435 [Planctomycetaceae bacterium]|nr:hypothetical protein [Planctomycetaceae bacterium]
MDTKNYAQLLFTAVRETLETMAFAEVVPFSVSIGGKEIGRDDGLDDFILSDQKSNLPAQGSTSSSGNDCWGTASPSSAIPASADVGWGDVSADDSDGDDGWGTPVAESPKDFSQPDAWASNDKEYLPDADEWGASGFLLPAEVDVDPWGDAVIGSGNEVEGFSVKAKDINFQELIDNEEQWCWSCMRVNSPDVNAVWFVIPQTLALELGHNMYAGEEEIAVNSPLIRDLVAELTNVFGGKLMLLLEHLGGKFTLTVPEIGFGMPEMPENQTLETVLCRVLVDGEYPVIALLSFNSSVK